MRAECGCQLSFVTAATRLLYGVLTIPVAVRAAGFDDAAATCSASECRWPIRVGSQVVVILGDDLGQVFHENCLIHAVNVRSLTAFTS